MDIDAINIEDKLEDVYSQLVILTDGETDTELKKYNEYLLDNIQEAIHYIQLLEKKLKQKEVTNDE